MKKLRIVYIAQCLNSETGGARHHARSFVKAVRSLGYPILTFPEARSIEGESVSSTESKVHKFNGQLLKGRTREVVALLRDIFTANYLDRTSMRIIREFSPDVVIARPVGYDRCLPALRRVLGVPLVFEWNAPTWLERAIMLGGKEFSLRRYVEGWYLRKGNGIITVSLASHDKLVSECQLNMPVLINPNGIDTSEFKETVDRTNVRSEFGISPDATVVVQFGKLEPRDAICDLIREWPAMSDGFRNAHLVILGAVSRGEIDKLEAVRQQVGQSKNSVSIMDRLPHDKAVQLCRAIDIGVVPYRALGAIYGSSLQIFEYMASGVCVVAPAVGQLEQILGNGRGLTYRPNSQSAMVATVRKAISDGELRNEVARNARREVMGKYTWQENARRALDFCETICKQRKEHWCR